MSEEIRKLYSEMETVDLLTNLRQRLEKGEIPPEKASLRIVDVLEKIVEDHLCFKQKVENKLDAEDRLRRQNGLRYISEYGREPDVEEPRNPLRDAEAEAENAKKADL